MALPEVKINITAGGLSRVRATESHISAIIVKAGTSSTIKNYFTAKQAEDDSVAGDDLEFIKDYFTMQGGTGNVYYMQSDFDDIEADIVAMQNHAKGKIRQFAIIDDADLSVSFPSATLNTIDTALGTLLSTYKSPAVALYTADLSSASESDLDDLTTGDDSKVGFVLGQTGVSGHSIIGAVLGSLAENRVNDSIAWPERANFLSITDTPRLLGDQVDTLTKAALDAIDAKAYIFPIFHPGLSGVYLNGEWTASAAGDFDRLSRNRVMFEAVRRAHQAIQPKVESTIYLNQDGTLRADQIALFKSLVSSGLDQLGREGAISNYAVDIDAAQDVLATDNVNIGIRVQPTGVSRFITLNLTYVASI